MKKKYIPLLLTVTALSICLCSCGKNTETSAADAYLTMAQEFVDNDNLGAALEILQKGFDETKDERLAVKIVEISSVNVPEVTTENVTEPVSSASTEALFSEAYIGTWAEENIGWESGGLILDIGKNDTAVSVDVTFTQAAPYSRVASFSVSISESDIHGGQAELSFENDGWGNSGTIVLQFLDDTIVCTIKDTKYLYEGEFPVWGIRDGKYLLVMQNDAHEKMAYTPETEYEDTQPDEITLEGQQMENTGTMTVDEMKNNCLMFEWYEYDFTADTTLNPCMRSELSENPDAYINQLFVPCETYTEFIVCPDCMGSGYRHGIAENGTCYNSGYQGIEKTENNIHYILQEYPDQAMLMPISICRTNVDVSGTYIYEYRYRERDSLTDYIYDLREDKSIEITTDTVFVPYLVFLGKVDNKLKFGMFACDIIYNG